MEVVPVSHFIQNLAKPYGNLNHHGLGPIFGVTLFTFVSSQSNATVTHLELEDNCILAEGALIHSLDSSFLPSVFLNISNNHLDTAEAEAIASLLLDNISYLHALQLSGGLYAPKESHCLHTFFSLQGNYQVKKLDLSHNEFSEQGGQLLGQTLAALFISDKNSYSLSVISGAISALGKTCMNIPQYVQHACYHNGHRHAL
uniref:Uncharacterized protein n=1 Tax=Strix occidentalis caurina TaxID=311401 RepID=A0A8D0FNC5_STROC